MEAMKQPQLMAIIKMNKAIPTSQVYPFCLFNSIILTRGISTITLSPLASLSGNNACTGVRILASRQASHASLLPQCDGSRKPTHRT